MRDSSDLEFLTIQERIELYKEDMAFSPSDAARKVGYLAEAALFDLIDDNKFVGNGKSMLDERHALYMAFCGNLSAAVSKKLSKTDKSPYESRFGNRCSDYIYIAALCIASMPVRHNYYFDKSDVYFSLRMTLGNYLDALIDISCDIIYDINGKRREGKLNTQRADRYRRLKKEFSEIMDLSTPLCEAISILLGQYSESHAELDRINHIQRCKSNLDQFIQLDEKLEMLPNDESDSNSVEEENKVPDNNAAAAKDNEVVKQHITEIRSSADEIEPIGFFTDGDFDDDEFDDDEFDDEEIYDDDFDDEDDDDDFDDESEDKEQREKEMIIAAGDPYAYFLSKARKLPGSTAQSPEELYDMGNDNPNLLAGNDYSPEGLKAWAAELSPEFREIADELVTPESIANAFKGMDAAIDKLYRLLIEPFAEIEKYSFLRHLSSEIGNV